WRSSAWLSPATPPAPPSPGGAERHAADAHAGRVEDRVGDRRRHQTVHALIYLARSKGGTWERPMRNRAVIADQIDYWIRRHAIRATPLTPPSRRTSLHSLSNSKRKSRSAEP